MENGELRRCALQDLQEARHENKIMVLLYTFRTQKKAKRMVTITTECVDFERKRAAETISNDREMSLSPIKKSLETIMDETDAYCCTHPERLTHFQVFSHAKMTTEKGKQQ